MSPEPRAPERVTIPAWLPPVLYAVVTLVLFRAFVFTDAMLYGSDTESLGYMARAFYADRLGAGDFPGWNPLLLGGTPFLESLAGGDSLYPPSVLLLLLLEPYRALGWKLVLHVFGAGLLAYGWTRALGRSRAAALVAGLAYLVAPFMVTLVWPGHDGKLFVTALTPGLFWAVESWFARGRLGALAGIGAIVAFVVLTTHFQMAYFLFGAVGAYAALRAVLVARSAGRPRTGVLRFGAFLAASVVGAAAAGVQLLPALGYVTEFSRRTATTTAASPEENRAYAASWSLHPEEAVATLAIPEFVGSDVGGAEWTTGTYWGRNVFKLNHEYVGLVVVLLALLAFFGAARGPVRWFFLGLGALALLYALGEHTPVWTLAYHLLPGIKLFRAPSMAVFLTGFSAVTLAGFGIDRMLAWGAGDEPEAAGRGQTALWVAAGVLGLGMLLAAGGALSAVWTSVLYPSLSADKAQRLEAALPFIGRGFLLGTVAAGALGALLLLARRGWLEASGLVALLALLVTVDGLRVNGPFVTTTDPATVTRGDANVDYLLTRQREDDPFRVLDLAQSGQSVRLATHGIELVAGHHPNDIARYRELIGMVGSGLPQNLLTGTAIPRLLNVRYVSWPAYRFGSFEGQGIPLAEGAEPVSATQLGQGQIYEVIYRVPGLPRARLVAEARVVPDAEAVATIVAPSFDPESEAVLAEAPPFELAGGRPVGEVAWIERTPERQRLRVVSDRDALLVVADNWYPAWQARVDGQPAPLLRAYHTLRAVPVRAGEHEVELVWLGTDAFRAGLWASVLAWIMILGLAVASLVRRRRGAA